MPLNLYRRHYDRGRCSAGHTPNTQTYQSDELRRAWKKCACPIYASGRLHSNPKFRKNTKCFTWADARAVAEKWEKEGAPSDPAEPAPAVVLPKPETNITIVHATERCIAEYSTSTYAQATKESYQVVLKRVRDFASDVKGYVYLCQWQPIDTRELYATFRVAPASARAYLAVVKSFFEFCVENQWLKDNPARLRLGRRARAVRQTVEPAPREPFTDAEIQRMLQAAPRYASRSGQRPQERWAGRDLEDFLLISIHTGLRISDVVTFHISRLADNGDVHLRAIKNSGWVDTWVPQLVQDRIRARAAQYGDYIFGKPVSSNIKICTSRWRKRLDQFWLVNGPWAKRPTHHRFRHTFVRILLQSGMSTARVAELIGDTEAVVRRSYSRWVSERQDAMRSELQRAFAGRTPLVRVK